MRPSSTFRCLILLCLIVLGSSEVPLLDDDIGEAIFHDHTSYLIYVCDYEDPQIMAVFDEFCQKGKLCVKLDSSVDMYDSIMAFVGFKKSHYLLILDSRNYKKYTLPLQQTTTVSQIQEFWNGFQAGTLSQYHTSEDLPEEEIDPYLKKIVGLNFQDFVNGSSKLKVLFLFSEHQGCSNCKEVYDLVVKAAKEFPDRQQVDFGALDLFRNDHKLLNQQHIPLVLIYKNSKRFIRLEQVEEIEKLGKKIKKIIDTDAEL